MIITVVDVETTGLDPAVDRVVEIAGARVVGQDGRWGVLDPWSSLVNPGRPIPPEASAVHHLVDADVADAPSLEEAIQLGGVAVQGVGDIIAAHNCRFDRSFLPMFHEKKWLDTYRCAMHVWPDAPNFRNQTLRYWLGLDLPHGRTLAHIASGDVTVTAHVLVRLLAERPLDELLRLSTKACVLKKVGFGKHFGQLWSEVPWSYLDWASKQRDMDPDVKFTVQRELTIRAG